MKQIISKSMSISIVLALLLLMIIPCSATELEHSSSNSLQFSETELVERAKTHAISFLRMNHLVYSIETVDFSQAIPIQNDLDENNYIFFLFVDKANVGYMNAGFNDGEYLFSFVPNRCETIDYAVFNALPISVLQHESSVYLKLDDQITALRNGVSTEISIDNTIISSTTISLTALPVSNSNLSRGSGVDILLSVPRLSNSSGRSGLGLCWAACIASISNYLRGTSYTAISLETKMDETRALLMYYGENDPYEGDQYATGVPHIEKFAFSVTQLNYVEYENGLSFYEVVSILNQGKPVYAGVSVSAVFSDVLLGHAVVVCGAYIDPSTNNCYYTLMDPNNSSSYLNIYVQYPNDTSLRFNSDGVYFWYWIRNYH